MPDPNALLDAVRPVIRWLAALEDQGTAQIGNLDMRLLHQAREAVDAADAVAPTPPPRAAFPLLWGGDQYDAAGLLEAAAGFCVNELDDAHLGAAVDAEGTPFNLAVNVRLVPVPPADAEGPTPLGGRCPSCRRENAIVNECGCDPDNLPTRVGA